MSTSQTHLCDMAFQTPESPPGVSPPHVMFLLLGSRCCRDMLCILTPLCVCFPCSPPKSCMLGHLPNLDMWNCFFSGLDSSNVLTNWLEGVPGKVTVTVTRKVVNKPGRSGDPGTAPGFSTASPPVIVWIGETEFTALKGK